MKTAHQPMWGISVTKAGAFTSFHYRPFVLVSQEVETGNWSLMFLSSEQVSLSRITKSHQKYLTATSGFDILTDVSWFSVERSHSGLVRRFAKPLRGKPLREFESLPLRHRGYAERLRQPSPKRSSAGSTPAAPAEAPNCLGTFVLPLIIPEVTRPRTCYLAQARTRTRCALYVARQYL